jgi:hypothetical protein
VTLSVDGASLHQPLEILPDPRVKASAAAYKEEFALARRIEADRALAAVALAEIGMARAALGQLATASPFSDRLAALTDPGHVTSLAGLAETLAKLQVAVDGADGGPSPDARAGFALADKALATALAAWAGLKAEMTAAKE